MAIVKGAGMVMKAIIEVIRASISFFSFLTVIHNWMLNAWRFFFMYSVSVGLKQCSSSVVLWCARALGQNVVLDMTVLPGPSLWIL